MTTSHEELVKRVAHRAATLNGSIPVGAGDGGTYVIRGYDAAAAMLDHEIVAAIISLVERVKRLEVALQRHACSCPGACERKRNNAYAEPDMCCVAHDALAPDSK